MGGKVTALVHNWCPDVSSDHRPTWWSERPESCPSCVRGEWQYAIHAARWGLALGFGYLVLCTAVMGWDSLSRLERTASHGDELVRTVPYWRNDSGGNP